MKRQCFAILSAVFWVSLVAASTASAGNVFVPGAMKEGKFVAAADPAAKLAYEISFAALTGEIAGSVADIELAETIVGPEDAVDAVLLFALAPATVDSSLNITIKRDGKETAAEIAVLDAEASQSLLEMIAKETGDVRYITLTGEKLAVANISLAGKIEIAARYQTRVNTEDDVNVLSLPLSAAEFASKPIDRVDARLTLETEMPQRLVFSPSHEADVDRESLQKSTIRIKAENWASNEGLKLLWVADASDLGLRVLTYRESADEDGYFMVVGNPTGGKDEKPIAKDVVFVLDTSGSMRGEKIEQCRAAIEYCLTQLQPQDRFNIVTFGTEVTTLAEQPISIEESNLTRAQNFVEDIVAQGKTNIEGALKAALLGNEELVDEGEGRPRMVIFLTDGVPTAGELRPEKIIEQLPSWNAQHARVFVMGAGNDVNAHLLDKIATATEGSSEYIIPQEEIDEKVAALYNRLAHPVLTNVAVSFGELNISSQYPEKLGPLFRNSEVMVLGRFQDGGKHKVVIRGELNGEKKQFERVVEFPAGASAETHEFVAPLWAARNIGFLLQEIRLHGEDKELLEEVVRLSKKFGIVTEYTSFLGSGGSVLSAEELQNEVTYRVQQANQIQTGKWAVQQARNDIGLQNRAVVNFAANCYFDRRGERVVANNIRQIGAGCYYLNDGQWVASDEAGDRKERKVELFSDEYFTLLRQNDDFRRSQQLGWAVSLNVGDERIVVTKDGKHQSEELLEQSKQSLEQQNEAEFGNTFQFRNQIEQGFNRGNFQQNNLNLNDLQQQLQNAPRNNR